MENLGVYCRGLDTGSFFGDPSIRRVTVDFDPRQSDFMIKGVVTLLSAEFISTVIVDDVFYKGRYYFLVEDRKISMDEAKIAVRKYCLFKCVKCNYLIFPRIEMNCEGCLSILCPDCFVKFQSKCGQCVDNVNNVMSR